jgi:hypothetical protein
MIYGSIHLVLTPPPLPVQTQTQKEPTGSIIRVEGFCPEGRDAGNHAPDCTVPRKETAEWMFSTVNTRGRKDVIEQGTTDQSTAVDLYPGGRSNKKKKAYKSNCVRAGLTAGSQTHVRGSRAEKKSRSVYAGSLPNRTSLTSSFLVWILPLQGPNVLYHLLCIHGALYTHSR